MTEQKKSVWVKPHGPSKTWYVLCDWLYGRESVDSYFEDKADALARAKEVVEEHDAILKVWGTPTADS